MKQTQSIVTVAVLVAMALSGSSLSQAAQIKGEAKFKEHCASCHADGGNIIKADKGLGKKAREKNGIKNAKDIVTIMRNPGPGMTAYDKKALSDQDAKAIADYIIKTFK